MAESMSLEQQLVLRRRELMKMGLAVAERHERGTGMPPGPQAEGMLDELLTVWSCYWSDLQAAHEWDVKIAEENPAPMPQQVRPEFDGVPMPASLINLDLLQMVAIFDVAAPKVHGELARHFLARAQTEGAQGDVLEWLRITADRDLIDGVITISWKDGESLPPPGDLIKIANPLSPGDEMIAKVVGFGKDAGTIRIKEADEAEHAQFREREERDGQADSMWDDDQPVFKVTDSGFERADVDAEAVYVDPNVPPPDPANSPKAGIGPKTSYGGS